MQSRRALPPNLRARMQDLLAFAKTYRCDSVKIEIEDAEALLAIIDDLATAVRAGSISRT